MHSTLETISTTLAAIAKQINDNAEVRPISLKHGSWAIPGITKVELASMASEISADIKARGLEELGANESRIEGYQQALTLVRDQVVPQLFESQASQAITAYMVTLEGLKRAVTTALEPAPRDVIQDSIKKSRREATAIESRLSQLNQKVPDLEGQIEKIQDAYETANRLPTDMDELDEQKKTIGKLLASAKNDSQAVQEIATKTDGLDKRLDQISKQAEEVLKKCGRADAADTSKGLAKAFEEKSNELKISIRFWVVGLIAALFIGGMSGSKQLSSLLETLKTPGVSDSVVWANLILALISIGAPIWFAFLAQKQIGFKFRLAEDYAYKASISSAYEGYRQEAARMDNNLEVHLLASALSRLDEVPLRLVEPKVYGSPLQEILESENVKEAAKSIPGFITGLTEKIQQFTDAAIVRVKTPSSKGDSTSEKIGTAE